jgi:hypothetical protein
MREAAWFLLYLVIYLLHRGSKTERNRSYLKEDDGGTRGGSGASFNDSKTVWPSLLFYPITFDSGRIYCLSARQLANVDVGRSGQGPQVEHLDKK